MQAGAHIGSSIRIKGELTASEDVTIAGSVEGTIKIEGHVVIVEPGGRVAADVAAKGIVVCGTVKGKLTAVERIEVRNSGVVEGELTAPRIGIADGASIQGKIEMAKRPRMVAPKVTAA
jgi:cytoskeletal protein CcmA (bactofilin family)